MSAIDAKPKDGAEGFDPGPDAWWGPVDRPLHTEGPNPLADLFGNSPGGGSLLQDALQPKSFGSEAHGTVKTSNPFDWLID